MPKAMEDHLDCGGCNKSLEEVIYWKHIKRLRFCVVLRPDFLDKLPIPKKFAENMKPNIFHPKMTLRGPSGASWEVNLMTSVNGIFLQDGWQEFVQAHSLKENEILIFKYDRNSSFDVKIFNGQCEKEAAYFVKKCGHVNDQKRRVSSETVVRDDVNGNVRASKKVLSHRKPIHLALQFLRKKAASRSSKELPGGGPPAEPELIKDTDQNGSTNKEASSGDQIHSEVNEVHTPDAFQKYTRKRARLRGPHSSKKRSFSKIEYVSHRRKVTEEEKMAALLKASSEPADRSFFAALPVSSCYKGYYMTIPAQFAAEHFHCRNEDVILRVGEEKWLTRYCFRTDRLGSGWRRFALDNHLEEFDVCLFRLVSKATDETMMLDVTIFRVVEEVTPLTVLNTPPDSLTGE